MIKGLYQVELSLSHQSIMMGEIRKMPTSRSRLRRYWYMGNPMDACAENNTLAALSS